MGKISSNMYRKQEEEKLPTLKCELISDDRKAETCINSGKTSNFICISKIGALRFIFRHTYKIGGLYMVLPHKAIFTYVL